MHEMANHNHCLLIQEAVLTNTEDINTPIFYLETRSLRRDSGISRTI